MIIEKKSLKCVDFFDFFSIFVTSVAESAAWLCNTEVGEFRNKVGSGATNGCSGAEVTMLIIVLRN